MKNKKENIIQQFCLTIKEIEEIKKEKNKYKYQKAAAIEALKIAQKYRGWVSDNVLLEISKILKMTVNDLESIATFYSQIFRRPVGKYVIRYCDSFVCYINGYQKILEKIKNNLNIKVGETTLDKKFTLLPTCCLGSCDKSPVIMINDNFYYCLNVKIIDNILEYYKNDKKDN